MEEVEKAKNLYEKALEKQLKQNKIQQTQYLYCIDCGEELNKIRRERYCNRCLECQKRYEEQR